MAHDCVDCNKSFAYKSRLQIHMLTHSGEKLNKCQLCPGEVSIKGNLKRHLLTYSGEKPYICTVCDKKVLSKRLFEETFIYTFWREIY